MLLQNDTRTITKDGREVVGRREADPDGLPPGRSRLGSPCDTDARWGVKRGEFWNGDKVHLSETCTAPGAAGIAGPAARAAPAAKPGQIPDRPNLITGVATTDATVPDAKMADKIHQPLAARGLLPAEHDLDSGDPSAELIAGARATHGIALVTPVLLGTSVQANAGFQAAAFAIDWPSRRATCPQGKVSSSWSPCTQHGTDKTVVKFAGVTCGACPVRGQCTTAKRGGRQLTLNPRDLHDTLRQARTGQDTKPWQADYALRAGVEGTIRQAIAVTGLRRARYRGLAKTHLEHVYAAAALNLTRLDAWWNGHPLDRTRTSHLARLELALAA